MVQCTNSVYGTGKNGKCIARCSYSAYLVVRTYYNTKTLKKNQTNNNSRYSDLAKEFKQRQGLKTKMFDQLKAEGCGELMAKHR